jgi:Tn3 transposase DDE domain
MAHPALRWRGRARQGAAQTPLTVGRRTLRLCRRLHRLARRVCHGDRGEIRKAYRQEQEEQLGALGLTLNAIALWNATYIQAALDQLTHEGWDISQADIARVSPLAFKHINFLGRYAFDLPQAIAEGALRPLRNPNSE